MTAAEAMNHRWLGRTSSVSTNNLFANVAPPGAAASEAETEESELATAQGLRETLANFQIDRKTLPEKLIKIFDLPDGSERLGKFGCSLTNTPGQLHVTTEHLCFMGALGKKQVPWLGHPWVSATTPIAMPCRLHATKHSHHGMHACMPACLPACMHPCIHALPRLLRSPKHLHLLFPIRPPRLPLTW